MTRVRSKTSHTLPLAQCLMARPEEAAELMGVGCSTIYVSMRAGEMHAVHIGRATRMPGEDLRLWVAAHDSAGAHPGNHHQLEARGRHAARRRRIADIA